MMPLLILFIVQLMVACAVIFILKRVLDRELEKSAIEKLASFKFSGKVDKIMIYYASALSLRTKEQITSLIKQRFTCGEIVFEQLRTLKGGLMIKIADEVFDFSLSSRLESFWS